MNEKYGSIIYYWWCDKHKILGAQKYLISYPIKEYIRKIIFLGIISRIKDGLAYFFLSHLEIVKDVIKKILSRRLIQWR